MNLFGNAKTLAGRALLTAGVLFSGATAALAQQSPQNSDQPARAVRLSYVDGQVQLLQGDQVLADQAVANTPLFEGMQLTTADDGKAEIQFEDGSVARLAPDSSLTLSVLRGSGDAADAELSLDTGLAYFELQGTGQAGQFGIHFGSSTATASGFTALRVDMDTPPGSLAVFSGNVHLEIDNATGPVEADLHGGESIALNPADPGEYSLAEAIEPNSWDAWNSDRDEELTAEAAQRTEAPANTGGDNQNPAWNDLDANGSWYDVPDQGYVWSPYDASNPDFDPYGNGDWIDTPSYGYIWVSGYPWGYMPYQCGSWNYYSGFGWGWSPGAGVPWWRHGGYRGPNIVNPPVGYRPVPRPHPPIGRPLPMIRVSRHSAVPGTPLPARDRDAQVTIAGSTVSAMQPLPLRPMYEHRGFASSGNRLLPGYPAAGTAPLSWAGVRSGQTVNPRPIYTFGGNPAGERPAQTSIAAPFTPAARPGFTPLRPQPEHMAPPRPQPQNGSPAPRYAPPRPAPSGGQSRPSMGGAPRFGGGGNGGGSHSGGGGGGSHGNSGGGGHR